MPFYRTIPLFGEELQEAENRTLTQDKLVLLAFTETNMDLSPSMVRKYLIKKRLISDNVPHTSIRRSVSDLTKEGFLEKTERLIKGDYNCKEHIWKLKNKNNDTQ